MPASAFEREPPPSVDYEKEKPWFLGGGFIEVRERERERYEACRWVGGNKQLNTI